MLITTTAAASAMRIAPIRAKATHLRDNHPLDRVHRSDSRTTLRVGLAVAPAK